MSVESTSLEEIFACIGVATVSLEETLDSIEEFTFEPDEDGHHSEKLQDAIFFNERVAQVTLSSNRKRLLASSRLCFEAVAEIPPCQVTDLGGGCGLVLFYSAKMCPQHRFVVVDRSKNALKIGGIWAKKLGITNIEFVRFDFSKTNFLANQSDLCLLEYVLDLASNTESTEEAANRMFQALRAASQVTKIGRDVRIRFGQFSEQGLEAFVGSACRAGLRFKSMDATSEGYTCIFTNQPDVQDDEMQVIAMMMDSLSAAYWRTDDGD